MITVRVVFLGLIGFVPSPEGLKDLAALLVDPVRAETHEMACPVKDHIPFVFLLHGKCENNERNCKRIFGPWAKNSADETGLSHALQARGSGGLLWILHREDLEISGDEDEKLDLRHPLFSFIHRRAPGSLRQASYFSWVPGMDRLAKGHAQIRNDCRRGDPTCPLHARFRIDGGQAGACHLFHDQESSQDTKRNVRIFAYTLPDQGQFRQTVADAVMVEFKEDEPYVTLRSQGLPGQCRPRVSVRLTPDHDGEVTLIVGNLVPPDEAALDAHRGYVQPHSDVLFNLLTDQVARPVRMPYSKTVRIEPGDCEGEMVEFTSLLDKSIGFREYPHAVTACDGISFPKPK